MKGRAEDINIRGAFLHMAADALVSAGAVVTGGRACDAGMLSRREPNPRRGA